MAAAVVHRAWRDSAPEAVEADLGVLWRELADHGPVARAVMSNLIVFRRVEHSGGSTRAATSAPRRAPEDATIEMVMARHPSRAIVIEHCSDRAATGPSLDADVGVSVFGTPAAPYGVETIVIRSNCNEESLPSIVGRFLRGPLPTSVWWTEDLSRVGLLPALVDMGRQLVFDSRMWRDVPSGLGALAPIVADGRVDLADLNWRRLAPFRLALVHAVASVDADVSGDRVRIGYGPGEAALAWLLAGWLAARLEWTADRPWPIVSESTTGEKLTVGIETGSVALTVSMNDHRVLVENRGLAPQISPVPRDEEGEAIAAELRCLSRESPFHDTLVALIERGVQS